MAWSDILPKVVCYQSMLGGGGMVTSMIKVYLLLPLMYFLIIFTE